MTDETAEFVTYNEQPKPRVLLAWKGPEVDALQAALDRCAGTVVAISHLSLVRQGDFDVLVTDDLDSITVQGTRPARHLCLLWKGRKRSFGTDQVRTDNKDAAISGIRRVLSASMKVSASPIHADFEQLLNSSLLPAELAQADHLVLDHHWVRSGARSSLHLRPLIATADDEPTAATYERSPTSEGVALPAHAPDIEGWVEVCLRRWARKFGQFPILGGWSDDPRWMTVDQEHVVAAKTDAEIALREATERLEARIEELRTLAEEEQTRAIHGPRRLLEEKGDPLVEAAIVALTTLGYEVTDLDREDEPADGGGKGEDIRLADPDASDFDPVVEVKGYDKGTKGSDIGKVVRHKVRAEAAGRTTDATWWIVNHNRATAPDERPIAFKGEDAMIARESLPENCGLVVIDTRDLFLAAKAVEAGTIEAATIRASLRSASGRWAGLPDDR
ncbi:MAG TPA: hypothetical protein VF228_10530 [Iamia sp.]